MIRIVLVGLSLVMTLFPVCRLQAQRAHFLGLNVAPLVMGTAELQTSLQVGPFLSLHAAGAFRYQQTDPERFAGSLFLRDYRQPQNVGVSLSAGARIFQEEGYERPYIQMMVSGIYLQETILRPDSTQTAGYRLEGSTHWLPAISLMVGFDIYLAPRWALDLALQASYAPQRQDIDTYYLPGTGYSTFGPGRFGISGAHLQPVVTIKYRLNKDRRDQLRQ